MKKITISKYLNERIKNVSTALQIDNKEVETALCETLELPTATQTKGYRELFNYVTECATGLTDFDKDEYETLKDKVIVTKPRTLSPEIKQARFNKELEKLRKRYNINSEEI